MDKVRYGIVGIGKQGGGYAAALAKGKDKNAVLAAVCDIDKVKLVNAARDWGVKTYENYEEMIKSGEIDAVIIDTPHYMHPSSASPRSKRYCMCSRISPSAFTPRR